MLLGWLFCSLNLWASPQFEAIPEETSLPQDVSTAEKNKESVKEIGEVVQGTVRLIRANPQTEVFFLDRKDSLIIPKNNQHNQIFEACRQSSLKRTPVSLRIDPKSRTIISLPAATAGPVESRSAPNSQGESSPGSN